MDDVLSQLLLIGVTVILTASVLTTTLFVYDYSNSLAKGAEAKAYEILVTQAEGSIRSINAYDYMIPAAHVIQFLDRYDGVISEVRTVSTVNFDALGYVTTAPSSTVNGVNTVNLGTPLIANLQPLIGTKVSFFVGQDQSHRYVAYIMEGA